MKAKKSEAHEPFLTAAELVEHGFIADAIQLDEKPAEKVEPMERATLRLPQSLWHAVLHQAIDQRVTATELVTRALRKYLKKGRRG